MRALYIRIVYMYTNAWPRRHATPAFNFESFCAHGPPKGVARIKVFVLDGEQLQLMC